MQTFIKIAGNGRKTARDMSRVEATEAMIQIMEGQASLSQVAAFMAVLRIKEETGDELAAFATTLRRYCQTVQVEREGLLDICLPYDGRSKAFSMTPAAACIAAAAGAAIALHGRLGPTTPPKFGLGVGDILAELGVPVGLDVVQAAKLLERDDLGLAFVATSQFAPRLEEFNTVRVEYGLRSFFNSIEKLINPFSASNGIVGVFHGPVLARVATALQAQGYQRGLAVHGPEGSLDVLPSRATRIVEFDSATMQDEAESGTPQKSWTFDPAEFGWRTPAKLLVETGEGGNYPPNQPANATAEIDGLQTLSVLSARMNAHLTWQLLQNNAAESEELAWHRKAALLSAALMLYAAGRASTIPEGLSQAKTSLESGAALERLQRWQKAGEQAGGRPGPFSVLKGGKSPAQPDTNQIFTASKVAEQ